MVVCVRCTLNVRSCWVNYYGSRILKRHLGFNGQKAHRMMCRRRGQGRLNDGWLVIMLMDISWPVCKHAIATLRRSLCLDLVVLLLYPPWESFLFT